MNLTTHTPTLSKAYGPLFSTPMRHYPNFKALASKITRIPSTNVASQAKAGSSAMPPDSSAQVTSKINLFA